MKEYHLAASIDVISAGVKGGVFFAFSRNEASAVFTSMTLAPTIRALALSHVLLVSADIGLSFIIVYFDK